MKLAIAALLSGSTTAFAPGSIGRASTAIDAFSFGRTEPSVTAAPAPSNAFTVDSMPGALPPMGFWDPLGFAEKADEGTLKRYREAEITHGRVAMLAVVGFLVGEAVEGSSFLFDAQITGPAITHPGQIPGAFDCVIIILIAAAEARRAQQGWVDPSDASYDQPGMLKESYYPGDLKFDPLGIRPEDPVELDEMITKELQNGRLAMLAAAGFLAQEAVDGLGILQHFQVGMIEKAIQL